ncbi:hypothetical protein HDV64DRAFT_255113 [Trichoderma sp. TUCIM 5745]
MLFASAASGLDGLFRCTLWLLLLGSASLSWRSSRGGRTGRVQCACSACFAAPTACSSCFHMYLVIVQAIGVRRA